MYMPMTEGMFFWGSIEDESWELPADYFNTRK
jgi:hypothetical protein